GVSLAGNCYTYVNPLTAPRGNSRWSWNGCPCCPPMFLKLMGAMPGYIYARNQGGIYVNLFVGSAARIPVAGQELMVKQTTDYPWRGDITITVHPATASEFDLHIRVPGWCQGPSSSEDLYQASRLPLNGAVHLKVNGKAIENIQIDRGYATLRRRWKSGDV